MSDMQQPPNAGDTKAKQELLKSVKESMDSMRSQFSESSQREKSNQRQRDIVQQQTLSVLGEISELLQMQVDLMLARDQRREMEAQKAEHTKRDTKDTKDTKSKADDKIEKPKEDGGFLAKIGAGIFGLLSGIARGFMVMANPLVLKGALIFSAVIGIFTGTLILLHKFLGEEIQDAFLWLIDTIMLGLERIVEDMDVIVKFFAGLIDIFAHFVQEVLIPILDLLLEHIGEFLQNVVQHVLHYLVELVDILAESVVEIIDIVAHLFEVIAENLSDIIDSIADFVDVFLQFFLDLYDSFQDFVQMIIREVRDFVDMFLGHMETLLPILEPIIDRILTTFDRFVDNIVRVVELITGTIESLADAFTSVFNSIEGIVSDVTGAIVDSLANIENIIETTLTGITEILETIGEEVRETIGSVVGDIESFVKSIGESMEGIIDTVFGGVVDVIESAKGAIVETMEAATDSVERLSEIGGSDLRDTASGIVAVAAAMAAFGGASALTGILDFGSDVLGAIGDFFFGGDDDGDVIDRMVDDLNSLIEVADDLDIASQAIMRLIEAMGMFDDLEYDGNVLPLRNFASSLKEAEEDISGALDSILDGEKGSLSDRLSALEALGFIASSGQTQQIEANKVFIGSTLEEMSAERDTNQRMTDNQGGASAEVNTSNVSNNSNVVISSGPQDATIDRIFASER